MDKAIGVQASDRQGERLSKADGSRARVLAAAARIFTERGYHGTTMRAVAQQAKMQASSLYYHYPSKDLLIAAVLDMGTHGVSTMVFGAIAELPPSSNHRDRIRAAILAHLRGVLTYGDYAMAARRGLGQVPPEVRRQHISRRDAYSGLWDKLLKAACDAGEIRGDIDVKLVRIFILGALNSALDWYRPQGMTLEALADHFCILIAEGVFAAPGRVG